MAAVADGEIVYTGEEADKAQRRRRERRRAKLSALTEFDVLVRLLDVSGEEEAEVSGFALREGGLGAGLVRREDAWSVAEQSRLQRSAAPSQHRPGPAH